MSESGTFGIWDLFRRLLAAGGVLVAILLLWMLAIVLIPSCRIAGYLANLLPENTYWPHDVTVQTLFKMRPHSCLPIFTTSVKEQYIRRYCFDQEYAPPNWGAQYRAAEDAFDLALTVDPQGLDIQGLILNFHPGVVTSEDPPYLGRMDIQSDNDLRFDATEHPSSNTADWWVTYSSGSFSTTNQIHVTYYALTSSTSTSSNSCKDGSKAATLTWSVKEFGITFDGSPLTFTTNVVDWAAFTGQGDKEGHFVERRATADRIRKADTAKRQNDPNDVSGWKEWQKGVLDAPSAETKSVKFSYCNKPETPCVFDGKKSHQP